MSIPTTEPQLYTMLSTGTFTTTDGKESYYFTAGTVIPMALAIRMNLPGAGYVSRSPFTTVEEARVASYAGREQRTDRFEPFEHRVVGSSAITSPGANAVYLSHFRLAHDFNVAKISIQIGGTSAGNIDLGIATSDDMATFTKVASSGVIAAPAINTTPEIALLAPYTCLAGVNYWLMFAATSATLIFRSTQGSTQITLANKSGLEKASAWSSGLPASVSGPFTGGPFQPWFTLIAPGA